MNVDVDFLLLPTAILTLIWDYCDAKDILALSSTCRTCKADIESWMLVVDARTFRTYSERDCRIPVFYPDLCHSIFLTCDVSIYARDDPQVPGEHGIVVASRQKGQSNRAFDTVVWGNTKQVDFHHCSFRISFRNDPSQEYCIRHTSHRQRFSICRIQLRKQFMTKPLTPAMKGALTACLNLGRMRLLLWYPMEYPEWGQNNAMQFFMKLFALAVERLSDISSPICKLFDFGPRRTRPQNIRSIQIQILNLFQQALEQKEPRDCVKIPQLSDVKSSIPSMDIRGQRSQTSRLPCLRLKNKFKWGRDKRRRCCRQDEHTLFSDELVFVARIPLAPKTTAFWLDSFNSSYSETWQVVVFFQKRQCSGIDNMEEQVYGQVLAGDRKDVLDNIRITVKPEHDACFLYVVPGSANTIDLCDFTVQLEIELDAHNCTLCDSMDMCLGGCLETDPVERRLFPIALFRACALALLGLDEGQSIATMEEFDLVDIDVTPESLRYIIETCDVLLQD